jgi:hypothetical protein
LAKPNFTFSETAATTFPSFIILNDFNRLN